MNPLRTVFVVLDCKGDITCICATREYGQAKVDAFNYDPFIDGEPDQGAPYTLEEWAIREDADAVDGVEDSRSDAPRFTRDEAIAIVRRMLDDEGFSLEPTKALYLRGVRECLEALADAGVFVDGGEHEPDGMRAKLNAAGIR